MTVPLTPVRLRSPLFSAFSSPFLLFISMENESLDRWFKEKWVDVSRKDKSGKHPPCGKDDSDKEGYPKCRPSKKVNSKTPRTSGSYSKKQKKSMTQSKRKKEKDAPSKSAGGGARKPKMSKYKPRNESIEIDIMEIIKETILEEWSKIDEGKLCARGKAAAKAKYDVYPSAYANGYAVQVCKGTKPGLDGKKRASSGYSKNEGHDGGCGCGCPDCGDSGEGGMAQNQLTVLANNAAELTQMFSEQSDLPEWVESKITKAADYINMVKNYMEGESMQGEPMMEDAEELEEGGSCDGPTKKTSSTAKGKKWMQCVKNPDGKGYKRVHWGQKGVRVTGDSGNTKRKKSFRARHGCKDAKPGTAKYMACKDW